MEYASRLASTLTRNVLLAVEAIERGSVNRLEPTQNVRPNTYFAELASRQAWLRGTRPRFRCPDYRYFLYDRRDQPSLSPRQRLLEGPDKHVGATFSHEVQNSAIRPDTRKHNVY